MFTISSACVMIIAAIVANVACDYDGNQGSSLGVRSLDGNGLCSGGSCVEQPGNGISGAMWFGPRLGRKRRSDEKIETTDQDIGAIADAINSGPWSFVQYQGPGDKRHTTQFTPRLGRELSDDFLQRYINYNLESNRHYLDIPDLEMQRQLPPPPPPPFAPRLGRQLTFNPSPRLGRRVRYTRKA